MSENQVVHLIDDDDALGCPGDDDPRSDDHNATGDDPGPRDAGPADGRHLRRHLGRHVRRHRRDLGRNRRRLLRRHQPLSALAAPQAASWPAQVP